MQFCWKPIITSLAVAALLIVGGCSGDGDQDNAEPAAIAGEQAAAKSDTRPLRSTRNTPASDPDHPVMLIETSLGKITVELDAKKAEGTAANFRSYAEEGHYDQTIFHQVYEGQGVVGGGFTADLTEKPTHTPIRNEADNGLKNLRGTIVMVRRPDAIDSATSQFFFNLADNPELDHQDRTLAGYGYCVFGKVTEGMDVLEQIGKVAVKSSDQFEALPVETVMIHSVRQIR